MTKPGRSLVAYNPHLLSRRDLLDGFIARQPLLDELVDDLRRGGGQHHLIIGARGSGKTTLLLRLACAVEDDKKLSRRMLALRFPEEQYNVGRLSDFWLNCVDALVDALERIDDKVGARELDAAIAELESLPEPDRAYESLKLLTRWAQKAKRQLVLLIDNFDIILDRLGDQHWALRETLSADNGLILVGASSSFIQESFSYESPFYDFFHVHELGPLDETEGRALILRLSDSMNTPQVKRAMDEDPGRFKALFLFSGGSPRTLALLHGVLAEEHTARAEDDLERLLDLLTPYYKARFDDLAAQSQLVVDAVALHWHPITAADCATKLRMETNQVSALLNRLVRQGVLSKLSGSDGGRLTFEVSERFFNVWYLMRASRRMRRKLLWLVSFLQTFYGEAEIERRAKTMLDSKEGRAATAAGPEQLLAFASAVNDPALRRRLEFRAVEALLEGRNDNADFSELLDLENEDAHLMPLIDRAQALRQVRAKILAARGAWPNRASGATVADEVACEPQWSVAHKVRIADDLIHSVVTRKSILARLRSGFNSRVFGKALLDAVGRGEVPGLDDVRSAADVEEVHSLVPAHTRDLVMFLLAAKLACRDQLLDPPIERSVELSPAAPAALMLGAGRLVEYDARSDALKLLSQALASQHSGASVYVGDPELWRPFVAFGHAAAAAAILKASRWSDDMWPLYEAMAAAGDGVRGSLTHLALELRKPAEAILARLYERGTLDDRVNNLVATVAKTVGTVSRESRGGKQSGRAQHVAVADGGGGGAREPVRQPGRRTRRRG